MTTSPLPKVAEFHEAFGQPNQLQVPIHAGGGVTELTTDRRFMRVGLVLEELLELVEAAGFKLSPDFKLANPDEYPANVVEMADALGDIVYVCYGMAIEMGINLDDVVTDIHESNMSKLDSDGKPIYRDDGKVLKGPNYRKPDIAKVIRFRWLR